MKFSTAMMALSALIALVVMAAFALFAYFDPGISTAVSVVGTIVQSIAIVVGGVWAYRRFRTERSDRPRADLQHFVTVLRLGNDERLIRVVLEIRNVGPVLISPPKGLVGIYRVDGALKPDRVGETYQWPPIERVEIDFRADSFSLEPGEVERYPIDFRVPASIDCIEVFSKIECDADGFEWDEATVHNLNSLEIHPATRVRTSESITDFSEVEATAGVAPLNSPEPRLQVKAREIP